MYADVLLLRLHHPHPFLPHRPDDSEDVDVFGHKYLLQYSVEGDEGAATTHSGAAVNDYRSLIGSDSFSERPHEPRQGLRRTGNPEVRPGGEVKVLYHSLDIAL